MKPDDHNLAYFRALGFPAPATEYRFHPTRRWRFDYAWPDLMVALEIEGGVYQAGRHTRGNGYTEDCRKYSEAAVLGWCVVRATTGMMKDGSGHTLVERALALHGWKNRLK